MIDDLERIFQAVCKWKETKPERVMLNLNSRKREFADIRGLTWLIYNQTIRPDLQLHPKVIAKFFGKDRNTYRYSINTWAELVKNNYLLRQDFVAVLEILKDFQYVKPEGMEYTEFRKQVFLNTFDPQEGLKFTINNYDY